METLALAEGAEDGTSAAQGSTSAAQGSSSAALGPTSERIDRHPCDEGDKSFFYSLHCENPKRQCQHCGQWLCPYHFEPNGEGVVGGHSNCSAQSRSSARSALASSQGDSAKEALLPEPLEAEPEAEGGRGRSRTSSSMTEGLAMGFEVFMAVVSMVLIGGIVAFCWAKVHGGVLRHGANDLHRGHTAGLDADQELLGSWSGVFWAVAAVLVVLVCGGTSLAFCLMATRQAANKRVLPSCCPSFLKEGPEATGQAMGKFLASESMLGGLVTILGVVLSICFSDSDSGIPIWLLCCALPVVIRTKVIEYQVLPFYGGRFRLLGDLLPFVLSGLEVYDRFSDGLTLALMYKVDADVHMKWVRSFQTSLNPVLRGMAPLFSAVHLWQVAAFSLLVSLASQQVVGIDTKGLRDLPTFEEEQLTEAGYGPEAPQAAVAADVAGYGALARRFTKRAEQDGRKGMISVATGFVKSFMENMPQGMLATVLLGLRGRPLTLQPVICFSAIASTLSLAKQGMSILIGTFSVSRAVYSEDGKSAIVMFALLLPASLAVLSCSAYLAAKLVMIQLCPHHAWGIATGCIDIADLS